MSEVKIKPEEWIVERTCPNCHRSRRIKGIRKDHRTYKIDVNLPDFCIYCEVEKKDKLEKESEVNKNG